MNSILMKLLPVLFFPLWFEPNASDVKYEITVVGASDSTAVIHFQYIFASTEQEDVGLKNQVTPFKITVNAVPFLMHFNTKKADDKVTITVRAESIIASGTGSGGTVYSFPPKGGRGYYGS